MSKLSSSFFAIMWLIALCFFGLLCWGFIEIILWITSK